MGKSSGLFVRTNTLIVGELSSILGYPSSVIRLITVVAIAAVLTLIGLGGTRHTQAQDSRLVWAQINTGIPANVDLASVFMVDERNAWATGNEQYTANGIVYRLRWQNNHWEATVSHRFSTPLGSGSIVAISDANVWLIGSNSIFHKDGNNWQEISNPVPGSYLHSIQMFGQGDEGWIGGDAPSERYGRAPLLLHYKDGQWTRDNSLTSPGSIHSLHFGPDGTGYAVGERYGWLYNGQRWVEDDITCPFPDSCPYGLPYRLEDVRVTGENVIWALGNYAKVGSGPAIPPHGIILKKANGSWSQAFPGEALIDDSLARERKSSGLSGLSFSTDGYGLAVGWQSRNWLPDPGQPFIISYRADKRWHYEPVPFMELGSLHATSNIDSTHALAVGSNGLVMSYGYGGPPVQPWPSPTPLPTATPGPVAPPTTPIPDPQNPDMTYFPVVGHTLSGGFRDYWRAHGGLAQFGYPLTEEFTEISPTDGKAYTTQYFERARIEWHPENRPPYDLLLGLLGHTVTATRKNEPPFQPVAPQQGSLYFPSTRHNMAPQFVTYWRTHGGLPVYGYPISEPFTEVSQADGKPYLVQYFERNRFEHHPELPEAYRVSLGLLGVEVLKMRGWIP